MMHLSCNHHPQGSDLHPDGNTRAAAVRSQTTYCNPIDIDYTYMSHYRAERDVSYRSGADPAVVNFRGKYYMFVTRSHGYWESEDMGHWRFIRPQSWYFSGSNAPAAAVRDGKILAYGDPSGRGPIIETDNPVAYKPGGFLNGAGHGSAVKDNNGNHWHFSTMAISVNYKFERRLGMYPVGFEENGQMYVNTAYGDYPHYLPDVEVEDHKQRFTGWMLLSKDKPVKSNSVLTGVQRNVADEHEKGYMPEQEAADYGIEMINDEHIRTLWVAESNSDTLWFEMDLGRVMTLRAFQLNYQDFNATIFGKPDTLRQQFVIETSVDGTTWQTTVDFSENSEDRPHAYIELEQATEGRFIRFTNRYFPNRYLAIGEFRVFGNGNGEKPAAPTSFRVERQADARNADISWEPVQDAMGYVLYWGIEPDKLNNSVMIYDASAYELRALNRGVDYFFALEAFNENGISNLVSF